MKLNLNNIHIAIETEPGTSGEAVARALSRALDIPCFSREILDKAAELSGIPASQLYRYDGRQVRAAYDLMADDKTPLKMRPASHFVAAKVAACQALAAEGPCILLDRHAGLAMENTADHVRVFIQEKFENRAARIAMKEQKTIEEAKKMLKKTDREYRSYYCKNDRGWGKANHYDLCLNASDVTVDTLVETVLAFISAMGGKTPQSMKQFKVA